MEFCRLISIDTRWRVNTLSFFFFLSTVQVISYEKKNCAVENMMN
jgi:hypothetical protein